MHIQYYHPITLQCRLPKVGFLTHSTLQPSTQEVRMTFRVTWSRNPLEARDERFAQLIVTANHYIADFNSTSIHNLLIFTLLQLNRNSSQHAELHFIESELNHQNLKIFPTLLSPYIPTAITWISWIKTPWSIQPQRQQPKIRSNLLLDTQWHSILRPCILPTLLTGLPQCTPGSLAHSNYKPSSRHSPLPGWIGFLNCWKIGRLWSSCANYKMYTSMCSPTYGGYDYMIWLSIPIWPWPISSRSIPRPNRELPNHELDSVCGGRSSSPIPSHGFRSFSSGGGAPPLRVWQEPS